MRTSNWILVASHVSALALGLTLGYQIPHWYHSYCLRKETDQIEAQIKQNPKDADNWSSLGVSKSSAGDYSGARADFRKALELDSTNVTASIGIGNLYFQARDFDSATKWYANALEMAKRHNDSSQIATAQQLLKIAQERKTTQRKER